MIAARIRPRSLTLYPALPRPCPAGPRPRTPQDQPAGRGAGRRRVLHRRARCAPSHHAGAHRRVNAEIAQLTEVIERLLAPYEEQLAQAESMPGWGRRSAQDARADTGADMSRFPTPGDLGSWAGRAPLDHQSGKRNG